MDRLRIGITNTSYGVYGFDGAIERISAQGYDCIDYQGFVDIESDFFKLPEDEFLAEAMRQMSQIHAHGMEISQAHAPWRTPKDGDPEERKRWIEAMKKAIRGAKAMECHRFVVHPLFPYMDTAEHPEEVWAMNEEFLGALADYAKDYGVTVCLENMPFPTFPIATVEHCIEMLDRLNRDNLKICIDTGHAAIFKGSDVASAVRLVGDRLEAVHIHDNMGDKDEHLIPGDGIINWDDFAAALKEIGFNKVISLETSPKHTQHPKEEWEAREINLVNIARNLATKAF